MKAQIVTLERNSGRYGQARPPITVYAIRRTKRKGFLLLDKEYQYLKLRHLDTPEWRKRGTNSDFFDYYTVDSPEAILEKWNYKPKTKEELEREQFGQVVNHKELTHSLETIVEDEMNASRIDRLGIDTNNDSQRQPQRPPRRP